MSLINLSTLHQALGTFALRFDVDALDSCSSTNELLLERALQGVAPGGSVLVADTQTAGRGRRGRAWASSPEDSLTFSMLWRTGLPPARLGGLSLAVGLAMARGLDALGVGPVLLKWPNDLLCRRPDGDAKLGGILVELVTDRRGVQVVIGIGLNLHAPDQALVGSATAGLDELCMVLPERHVLLASLLKSLLVTLEIFEEGGFASLQKSWQERHAWQGRPVRLLEEGGVLLAEGKCVGVDDEGALLLRTPDGVQRFLAGDVSLRGL